MERGELGARKGKEPGLLLVTQGSLCPGSLWYCNLTRPSDHADTAFKGLQWDNLFKENQPSSSIRSLLLVQKLLNKLCRSCWDYLGD
ncbi:hypothetical protein QQF64_008675 [Cirrhinus molitorella]|uniref:Uncharacterized protein n=1 Tax=Cirrhinus molitorella TaxID=172907 RepID=A0ABR3M6V4_9TELE